MSTRLRIDRLLAVQRVHHLGKKLRNNDRSANQKNRPIIVALKGYPDVDEYMQNATRLRDTGLGVSRDYPDEVRMARKKLEGRRKDAAKDKKKATIAYPAKLIIDGVVVADVFPD